MERAAKEYKDSTKEFEERFMKMEKDIEHYHDLKPSIVFVPTSSTRVTDLKIEI